MAFESEISIDHRVRNYVRHFESVESLKASGQTKYSIACEVHPAVGITVRSIREYQMSYKQRFEWDSSVTKYSMGAACKLNHNVGGVNQPTGIVQASWVWGFHNFWNGDVVFNWGSPWQNENWNSLDEKPEDDADWQNRFVPFGTGSNEIKPPLIAPLDWQVVVVVWSRGSKKHKKQWLSVHKASELVRSSWNVYYL